jgi:hypothetical protein
MATLRMRWSKREINIVYKYPGQAADAHLLHYHLATPRPHLNLGDPGGFPIAFDPSLIEELKARGYDITTLKFEIKKLNTT